MQACTSTNYINKTDPKRMWSFLESIDPPLGIRERKKEQIPGTATINVFR